MKTYVGDITDASNKYQRYRISLKKLKQKKNTKNYNMNILLSNNYDKKIFYTIILSYREHCFMVVVFFSVDTH